MSHLRTVSQVAIALWASCTQALLAFAAIYFEGLSLSTSLKIGVPCIAFKLFTPQGSGGL